MRFFKKFLKNYLSLGFGSIGKNLYEKINLQQVTFEMTFVWPPNEGRYTIEGTS